MSKTEIRMLSHLDMNTADILYNNYRTEHKNLKCDKYVPRDIMYLENLEMGYLNTSYSKLKLLQLLTIF